MHFDDGAAHMAHRLLTLTVDKPARECSQQCARCEGEVTDAHRSEVHLLLLQGGFTRVLHSGKPDDLMDEIPTFVADPLPPEKHKNGGYVVINRPYAFVQWTSK